MKNSSNRFWKYIFPALYGLIVYFTIRLLLDSVTGMRFWERSRWGLTAFELAYCIFISYLFIWIVNRMLRWFDDKWSTDFSYKRIMREIAWLVLLHFIFNNLFLTTFTALTDDGAQWFDIADINTIPLLYMLIYYGIKRTRTFLSAYVGEKVKLEKITNDKLQTELKFLKAQYHPHFLFNALNTIYFQMDENVSDAKRSVEKFSELLRYQLYDQQQTVSISQEIRYLKTFIELQTVRSSERLQLIQQFDAGLNGQQVYPLLMLPLVENAFKYVGGAYWLKIEARMEGKDFHFIVSNATPDHIPLPLSNAGGIGIENLRRRLQLLYPDKHDFSIVKKENSFHAVVILKDIQHHSS
ncbi:MAG: sensor histidine kinase [Filimonas sp.]|nr:sensor histidine kinase [Filimonas sp.]